MALYRPDYKLQEAVKVVENLDDSEQSVLIKYLINDKNDTIEKQRGKLDEFYKFFNLLDRFLPNKNQVY